MHTPIAEEEQNNSKIDSLQAAIIKYNHQNSCLSEDVLDWLTMCRLEEEVILLEVSNQRMCSKSTIIKLSLCVRKKTSGSSATSLKNLS